jgi:nucleoid-associated protein YgaU
MGPIEFVFDSTDTGKDVRDTYKVLIELATVDEDKKNTKTSKGQPPLCRFEWGKFLSFTAVITELNQTFTMFKADGTPVRAKVAVKLLQVPEDLKPQNPTSRSESRKIWVVREGQTLDWIAYQEYGDPAQWRYIAETNNLLSPKDLQPGQVLKLVPLP